MYDYSSSYQDSGSPVVAIIMLVIYLAIIVITLVSYWKLYAKMGMPGWYSLIPFYGQWKLFEAVFGQGWYMLLLMVPALNVYVGIKLMVGVGKKFGKDNGFIVGIILLSMIFIPILAFGEDEFDEDLEYELF